MTISTILPRGWRFLSLLILLFTALIPYGQAATPPFSGPGRALAVVPPITDCAELADVDLSSIGGAGSKVMSVREVVKGDVFCEVKGLLKPTINFTVLLPINNWGQRYLQLGCGGLCGRVQLQLDGAAGCTPLNNSGFVIAATDMGHVTGEADFGKDPQKRRDFAYRSVHLTSVATKKLISAYYGRAAAYAYFSGCSDGGREALVEAQRYPNDFNGIIAGAPVTTFQVHKALDHGWNAVSNTDASGNAIITARQLPMIHQAVLERCDAEDGQKDGLISDPQNCHFDPSVLSCADLSADNIAGLDCLSEEQISTLRKIYAGPRDSNSGLLLTPGGPLPGSELAWAGLFVPKKTGDLNYSQAVALSTLKYLNFEKNPPASYTLKDLKFNKQTLADLTRLHPLYDATNSNLQPFYAAGGKLILWHGWADPSISPLNSLAYHQALAQTMGAVTREKFERLYMLPGVYHCSTGEGPSQIDFLSPMLDWVELGKAPDSVVSYQVEPGQKSKLVTKALQGDMKLEYIADGAVSRPVFPYPDYAVYRGKSDVRKAENYMRKRLANVPQNYPWLGEGMFKPYSFAD
ncbi:tannase/feruloyl esterase family alpha/beta hydrolase [Rouxiella sp. S1S-2]|nr:tannase/feruloyl esterase family alpha/beta hydrolase [Rouxiella sp. S1S-2]